MRKFCFIIAIAGAIWAGTPALQMNSARAQAAAFTGTPPITSPPVVPLTNNQPGFTNTLVQATNLPNLQLPDLLAMLLSLQTNVEATLPELAFVTSNINIAGLAATNSNLGPLRPITSAPPSLVPPPTARGRQQTSFTLTVGTNTFDIDPATLQALISLRNNLELTLPVLQALNGTSPTPAIASAAPTHLVNPAVTTFIPSITQPFMTPLTNQPPFLAPGVSSAF